MNFNQQISKNNESSYQRCKRCIMDTTDPNIQFDDEGICNHCRKHFRVWNNRIEKRPIAEIWKEIQQRAEGNYDAILGVSGGADSCYLAWLAHKAGLNILLVHADDGFNTQAAKRNVDLTAENTGFDIEYRKIPKDEMCDIIRAYLKAGVVGLESPSDNVYRAVVHNTMDDFGINNILSGGNWQTESIMPSAWGYDNKDTTNIKAIHNEFGTIDLKDIEFISLLRHVWRLKFSGIAEYRPLNHIDYKRNNARKTLNQEWGWVDYGRKHNENRYTRFVECYIFPRRFGYDKRLAHYSNLICNDEITREEALKRFNNEKPYPNKREEEKEKEFILSKLGIDDEFENYMNQPIREHEDFKTHSLQLWLVKTARRILGQA